MLALFDAVAWPVAWIAVAMHLPQPAGIVGPMIIALAVLSALGRAHRAAMQNHRYHFTTWRWAATTTIHVRVDEHIKNRATETLSSMGLNVSDAVRALLTRVVADQRLPFMLQAPNASTRAAMREARSVGKARAFASVYCPVTLKQSGAACICA